MRFSSALLAAVSVFGLATPAFAAPGDPVEVAEGVTLDPIIDLRLRYEGVDQDNALQDADAITLRLRTGIELKASGFFALIEGEGTLAIGTNYNDTIPGNGVEPYSVVADPDNIELNRAAIGYMKDGRGITVGRQRIIHDKARWVGNVGWRQNEQTFDAVRAQGKFGPVTLDAAWSNSQRTIFGIDSPNQEFDGDLILLNGGVDLKPVKVTGFAYLIDYDLRTDMSSQTYGVLASGSFPIGKGKIDVLASIARQSDYQTSPLSYDANYLNFELGGSLAGFGLMAGYEELGSDGGVAAVQTPLATLHAFNGWADVFLTTPATGLRDYYISASKSFKLKALPGLKAGVTYHKYESDFGGLDYGSEWDAVLGFKLGRFGLTAKYANYDANGFSVDTEKFWLQAEVSY